MKRTSIIIAARNEANKIQPLVSRLKKWRHCFEVIVVANGCSDSTARRARRAGARVLEFEEPLGPDVGRAIGIAAAKGDIYLVLDADLRIYPNQLNPFVLAVEKGVDIALNRYPLPETVRFQHPTAVAKHALNLFAERPDLAACSLTAVPHALSRRVVKGIGAYAFAVPPVAQAAAMLSGSYRIEPVAHVPVGILNPMRSKDHQKRMRNLIIGDCLEAVHLIHLKKGVRGGFTDLHRKRELIPAFDDTGVEELTHIAAVVPAQGEDSLLDVVESLSMTGVGQVVVVQNGSEKIRFKHASQKHVKSFHYDESVGHDVGRAIGCAKLKANGYFITDADILMKPTDMKEFMDALKKVDVALNSLDEVLPKESQTDAPSIVKRFVNLACNRPDLGVASLTAIPHAITRQVVESIGVDALAVPPLAQVKAILAGFSVQTVHSVDVIHTNAYRPKLHAPSSGRPVSKLITGDCLEALFYLQSQIGIRAYFPDNLRRRDLLV